MFKIHRQFKKTTVTRCSPSFEKYSNFRKKNFCNNGGATSNGEFSNFVTIQLFLLSWLLADWKAIMSKKNDELDTYTKTVIIVVIVTSIMYIPITVICLIGLHRNISHFVNVYLLYTLIYIVVVIFLLIGCLITGHADIGFVLWALISIILCIYFYLVIRSYYLKATSSGE
ncbi:hypothetical protein HW555_003549 [Spodoptera exigua]|uniref:Uncharacterized protein n=1 Tax=Spodoptera exigua TaxID=7107 RepID=A0A835L658_SPOEX|nr:hypothetical protein HW555_003549 [Spodoptera exigua]